MKLTNVKPDEIIEAKNKIESDYWKQFKKLKDNIIKLEKSKTINNLQKIDRLKEELQVI